MFYSRTPHPTPNLPSPPIPESSPNPHPDPFPKHNHLPGTSPNPQPSLTVHPDPPSTSLPFPERSCLEFGPSSETGPATGPPSDEGWMWVPPTPQGPRIHPITSQKVIHWNLKPDEIIVVLGDQNILTISPHLQQEIQLDSFPEPKLHHLMGVLEKFSSCPMYESWFSLWE